MKRKMISMLHAAPLLVLFLGIVYWAFSARRRDSFDRAAQSVLDDDTPGPTAENKDG